MKWHCVCVYPRKELSAAKQINKGGYRSFCPLEGGMALIPRYVFLYCDPDFPPDLHQRDWRLVGIKSYLTYAGSRRPYTIPDEEMDWLIHAYQRGLLDRTKNGTFDTSEKLRRMGLKPGDAIRVNEEGFIGFMGELLEARPDDRVVVLFNFFGRKTKTEIKLDNISPIC